MSLRSLGKDESGIEQFIGVEGDQVVIKTTYDNEAVIERNKLLQNEDGFGKGKDMWLAASIPVGIQYEWMAKYGVNLWDKEHEPAVRRLLNSSDYRWLRVKNFII